MNEKRVKDFSLKTSERLRRRRRRRRKRRRRRRRRRRRGLRKRILNFKLSFGKII